MLDEIYLIFLVIRIFRGLYDDLQDIIGGPALSLLGVSTHFRHILTVTLRKSLPPTLRAGPVGPRVLILRTCHVIGSRMSTGLIAYSKRSCNIKSNFHHRFPFPVNAVFKISFPV